MSAVGWNLRGKGGARAVTHVCQECGQKAETAWTFNPTPTLTTLVYCEPCVGRLLAQDDLIRGKAITKEAAHHDADSD